MWSVGQILKNQKTNEIGIYLGFVFSSLNSKENGLYLFSEKEEVIIIDAKEWKETVLIGEDNPRFVRFGEDWTEDFSNEREVLKIAKKLNLTSDYKWNKAMGVFPIRRA